MKAVLIQFLWPALFFAVLGPVFYLQARLSADGLRSLHRHRGVRKVLGGGLCWLLLLVSAVAPLLAWLTVAGEHASDPNPFLVQLWALACYGVYLAATIRGWKRRRRELGDRHLFL